MVFVIEKYNLFSWGKKTPKQTENQTNSSNTCLLSKTGANKSENDGIK